MYRRDARLRRGVGVTLPRRPRVPLGAQALARIRAARCEREVKNERLSFIQPLPVYELDSVLLVSTYSAENTPTPAVTLLLRRYIVPVDASSNTYPVPQPKG